MAITSGVRAAADYLPQSGGKVASADNDNERLVWRLHEEATWKVQFLYQYARIGDVFD